MASLSKKKIKKKKGILPYIENYSENKIIKVEECNTSSLYDSSYEYLPENSSLELVSAFNTSRQKEQNAPTVERTHNDDECLHEETERKQSECDSPLYDPMMLLNGITDASETDATLEVPGDSDLAKNMRSIKSERKLFACYHCTFSTDHRMAFKRHMKGHNRSENARCPECANIFSTVYKMREHYRTHTGAKPYKCSICGFSTSYSSSFKYHMRSHVGEKPYACSLCDFRAVSCTMLTRHKRVHSGEKPFKCHLCEYRARAKGTLKSHLRLHSGEKPFACNYCDKSFVTSSAVRKHLFVHVQSEERRCLLCGGVFTTKLDWRQHLTTHETLHRCQFCGTKPGGRLKLKRHLEKSKKLGPFDCKFCGKTFKYKCEFTKHLMVHDESKPFKCEDCHYKGPTLASLRFHTRTKHLQPARKLECADCLGTYDTKAKLIKHLCVRSQ